MVSRVYGVRGNEILRPDYELRHITTACKTFIKQLMNYQVPILIVPIKYQSTRLDTSC